MDSKTFGCGSVALICTTARVDVGSSRGCLGGLSAARGRSKGHARGIAALSFSLCCLLCFASGLSRVFPPQSDRSARALCALRARVENVFECRDQSYPRTTTAATVSCTSVTCCQYPRQHALLQQLLSCKTCARQHAVLARPVCPLGRRITQLANPSIDHQV